MKKLMLTLKSLIILSMVISANEVFAQSTAVRILHDSINEGRPMVRTEPIICTADKEAGYVRLLFRTDLGEIEITLTDSTGNVVDEISLNTSLEDFAILNIPNPQDSYTLIIAGERYAGKGRIN